MVDEKPPPDPFPTATRAPDHVAKLLARLARGWTPPPMRPRPVSTFVWGGEDLSKVARQVVMNGDELTVQCEGDALVEWVSDRKDEELRNKHFSGMTNDGGIFEAQSAGGDIHLTTAIGSDGRKQTGTLSVSGSLGVIKYMPTALWVARLMLRDLPARGSSNLVIETPSGWALRHLRLQGARYTYYIIRSTDPGADTYHLVMDIGDDSLPDLHALNKDVNALRFTLGQSLGLDILHGVDGTGNTVGYCTGTHQLGDVKHGRVRPPVPVRPADDKAWVAPLFRAVSQGLAISNAFLVPISWYTDSLDGHLDGEYVGLQIALGSLARAILEERKIPQGNRLVQSPQHWAMWCELQREELVRLAEPGQAETLSQQVEDAFRPSVEWLVRRAFEEVGLELLPEMAEELRQRARVLTSGEITHGAEVGDVDSLVTRVKIVRCMVAALVAKAIGYSGAVQGWKRDSGGHYGAADWFPVDEAAREEARQIYRAKTDDVPSDIVKLWPDFAEPQLPGQGLVRLVVSFAAGLAERTGGRVVAQVQPVVDAPKKKERWYEFKLLLAGHPSTQSVLLTIVDPGDGTLLMRDWGEDQKIQTEDELAKFLGDFARSEEVQVSVQRMMIYAEEARQE